MKKLKDFYNNLSVLVTGGAGFIGSHLAEKLVELGAKVTIIDNLSTGKITNLENIKQKLQFIQGDITDLKTCIKVTQNQKIIFHLAAFVSVPESIKNPNLCNDTNVTGTFNLLESAKLNNVEKLIFSSSSAVYGNKEGLCTEADSCNPTSIYGYSKLIGEIYCKQYFDFFNLKTICLRYFNVYGPRQNPNGEYAAAFAKFNDLMKNNKPITIFGDGKQTRDFINVNEVVNANLNLAMLENELNGQAVNIASGTSITLLNLIEAIKQNFPKYSENIIFEPARFGDVKYSQASVKLYKEIVELNLKEIYENY